MPETLPLAIIPTAPKVISLWPLYCYDTSMAADDRNITSDDSSMASDDSSMASDDSSMTSDDSCVFSILSYFSAAGTLVNLPSPLQICTSALAYNGIKTIHSILYGLLGCGDGVPSMGAAPNYF